MCKKSLTHRPSKIGYVLTELRTARSLREKTRTRGQKCMGHLYVPDGTRRDTASVTATISQPTYPARTWIRWLPINTKNSSTCAGRETPRGSSDVAHAKGSHIFPHLGKNTTTPHARLEILFNLLKSIHQQLTLQSAP